MKIKQSVFIATSLDGFIARPDGGLDWLTGDDGNSGSEDYGYQAFADTVDALVMGRNTFDKVLSFEQWPYTQKVVLLTNRPIDMPEEIKNNTAVMTGDPHEIVDRLADQGFYHLYIDGGQTIQQFLNAGLIQEMIITQIPVIIGEGIPLFGPVAEDIKLEHLHTAAYDDGFVQSRYQVLHHS